MLLSRLFDIPLCFLDFETTGASIDYGDRVTEIGILRIERGQVVDRIDQLVNPGRHITGGASAITGITDEMLLGQPAFSQCWPAIQKIFSGSVIIGHNIAFDLSFLHGECRRMKINANDALNNPPILDTVRIARKLFGRSGNGLQRLATRLGIFPGAAHRALVDCDTTMRVLFQMIAPLGGLELTLARMLELQGSAITLAAIETAPSALPSEIAEALVEGLRVRIRYLDARNNRTEREVTPKYVRRISGALTLVAHCHVKNDQRMFKLERIISAEPLF